MNPLPRRSAVEMVSRVYLLILSSGVYSCRNDGERERVPDEHGPPPLDPRDASRLSRRQAYILASHRSTPGPS